MRSLIKKCPHCGRYTLKDKCPVCASPTLQAIPPRYSPQDKYGKYRRLLKKEVENWKE